jgi:hypothetical protein
MVFKTPTRVCCDGAQRSGQHSPSTAALKCSGQQQRSSPGGAGRIEYKAAAKSCDISSLLKHRDGSCKMLKATTQGLGYRMDASIESHIAVRYAYQFISHNFSRFKKMSTELSTSTEAQLRRY